MRILFITNVYPNPVDPGKGVFNRRLTQALSRANDIRVVVPVSWVDKFSKRRSKRFSLGPGLANGADGVKVYYPRYYYPPKVLRNHYGWFYWRSVRRTVRQILEEWSPDAVIGYWAHPDGEVAVQIARLCGVPGVIMVGGSDVLLLTGNPGRRRKVLGALETADAVVPVSEDLKVRLASLGIPSEKMHVVQRGVDTGVFSPGDQAQARQRIGISPEGKVLVWVGRMVPVKGLDVLLQACVHLRDRGAEFHVYLVGQGPLESTLRATCNALGLADLVSFTGACPHDRLADWYRAADWTVLPSRSEGIPNVLRESLACGTPFVASDVGGIAEFARGSSCRLVPPGSSESLAAEILKAIAEPPRPKDFAPSQPTWADSAGALVGILDRLSVSPLGPSATTSTRPVSACLAESATTDFQRKRFPSRLRQGLRFAVTSVLPRRVLLSHGPATGNTLALSFDDGPHPEHTPRLLDTLRDQGVQATFFVIGEHALRHPDLIRRMAAEGHIVGNHTYRPHQGSPLPMSFGQVKDEIQETGAVLTRILGHAPVPLFRPPFGRLTARVFWWLVKSGYTTVLWNVDPKDYACKCSEDVRAWFAGRPMSAGDVVLMHDNHPHAASIMPDLISSVREQGLKFVPLSDWVFP